MMVGLRNFHGRREVVPDGNSIHEPQNRGIEHIPANDLL